MNDAKFYQVETVAFVVFNLLLIVAYMVWASSW
jgi:hypothetical protein